MKALGIPTLTISRTAKRSIAAIVCATSFGGAVLIFESLALRYLSHDATILYQLVYAGFVEEGFKYALAAGLLYYLSLPAWAVPFIGLGFGLMEHVTKFPRHFFSVPMPIGAHVVFDTVMAVFLYVGMRKRGVMRWIYFSLAYLGPAFLHFSYNASVFGKVL